ncbi:NADPH-dependent diflavin oxidoreductase 1, partial [Linum perenne]
MGENSRKPVLLLYASQTGNALDAAERVGREAERRGCPIILRSMDEFDASSLPCEDTIIFVVSTTGQGDAPDPMKAFWRFLLQKNLRKSWLQGVHYAVFGLGDSGYQKFNFVGKKLDRRLYDLGASAIVERGLGDDQHPSGYEGALDPWMTSLWHALHQMYPTFFPHGPDYVSRTVELLDQPKYQIIYHELDEMLPMISDATDSKNLAMEIERARSMSPGKLPYADSTSATFLKMIRNDPLTKIGSGKDVRHFAFEFISSTIKYDVGDVLEVLPHQNPASMDAFIRRCDLDPEAFITVWPKQRDNCLLDGRKRSQVMSFFASAEHEKERLQYFASAEGRDDLYQYNQKERRTVLEVLEDFPSVQIPFEWLVELVPPLKKRAFSIASSLSAHPNQVHLTVNIVSWTTPFKRKRSEQNNSQTGTVTGVRIPAWFHKGCLPAPPPSLPLILVGPGTGCAPFRGFLEERAVQETAAPIMFFFGCRNKDDDFLYRDLWQSHSEHDDGLLSEARGGGFYVAFSRDQPQKVYVQHKMLEQSQRIWKLVSEGEAAIYVAGSSTKMPCDVMSALEEIISREGRVLKHTAAMLIRRLERDGGGNAFYKAYGMNGGDYMGKDQRFREAFFGSISELSPLIMEAFLERYSNGGFQGVETLVDVGGGNGSSIHLISSRVPTIRKAINFDLPFVLEKSTLYSGVEHVAGDMFESVPKGDAIFMKWILHLWDDEQCLKILSNCYNALPENGKVVATDALVPETSNEATDHKALLQFSLYRMNTKPQGKERTLTQFDSLAKQAGFSRAQIACYAPFGGFFYKKIFASLGCKEFTMLSLGWVILFVGKKLDRRLYDLGASVIVERGLGDDQHPSGYINIRNDPLTKIGSGKDVRHFAFEFISSTIKYDVGDVLEVLPHQNPASMDAFIRRCDLDPEAFITVSIYFVNMYGLSSGITAFLMAEKEVMSFFASAEHEKERLQYFASAEGRDDLYQYNQKERRTVLEVLEDFPSVQIPFEWLVELVPPLKKRAFSIASSLSTHPNQVHLTVNIVSWTTPFKRKRAEQNNSQTGTVTGVRIPAWFHKGCLPAPPPSLPLILVGPGTGCAPFRGFLEERAVQETAAPIMFFFGCRNKDDDFLYRDLWQSHSEHDDGLLSEARGGGFYVAFSRDQPQKVYVQHKMLEQSQRIWKLVSEGEAAIYVAGSSTKMPCDVMSALEEIISREGRVLKHTAAMLIR